MEKREGGPKKWEAQAVHHKNEPTAALRPFTLQRDVCRLILSQWKSRGWGTMEGGTQDWEAH